MKNNNNHDETFSNSSGVSSVSETNKKDELNCSFKDDANNLNITDINNKKHLRLNNDSNMVLFNQESSLLSTISEPAAEAQKFKINTKENNINFNLSSKFMNKKKSYIIMNNENEQEQSRQQQTNINSNIKINVTKSNSTGSYSSDSSTVSSAVESSSCFNEILLKSKSDLSNKSPSSSSISSESNDSITMSKRKLIDRKNHDLEMEDILDSYQNDDSNSFNDENDPTYSNRKSISNNSNNSNNQMSQSFDSDLNYDDENYQKDEELENSEMSRKRKISKSGLDSYFSMVRRQNDKQILTTKGTQIINDFSSFDFDSHCKNKVKRIKSNIESSFNDKKSNQNDEVDFKSYLTRAISEILTSQMTLSKKVDKIKTNFFYINKKLKGIILFLIVFRFFLINDFFNNRN